MRLPFAKYGLRELVVACITLTLAFFVSLWAFPWIAPLFAALDILVLWFFRDPERRIPEGDNNILAPADGRVVEISQVKEPDFIGGPALKVGIFLSIFDVHINRAPCRGRVTFLKYQRGQFKNALRAIASSANESNAVGLVTGDEASSAKGGSASGGGKVLVKQIAGAIARRIVCECKLDDTLAPGQKFGMIKFGSRTELYLPATTSLSVLVKTGDKVLAGESLLARILRPGSGERK
jgi:phosphatidylserine decarboxylase